MREINATKQKILIIGLVGILILSVVMIGVMFFQKDASNNEQIKDSTELVENLNGENVKKNSESGANVNKDSSEKFLKLAVNDVFGLKIKKGTNQILFYQQQKLLTADPFTGQKHSIGGYPFAEVKKFLWSADASRVIVNDMGEYYIYDLSNNLANKFRETIDTAIWNKTGDKIIYKYYNPESHKRKIRIADVDGTNSQLLVDNLPYRKADLMLQAGIDKFCYLPLPDARVKGKLFCSSMNGENKKEYGGQYGQDYLWSPNGEKILTSFTKEEAGEQLVLGVINKEGGEAKGLSFGTTVKKCVWSKNNIDVYCAMMGGAPTAIMLPNAWDEQYFNSADTFWKINTTTGKKKRLVELDEIETVIDSENLVVDSEESFLFFVNRRDRSLWRLKL